MDNGNGAGPSRSSGTAHTQGLALSLRQRQKAPARQALVSLGDIRVDDTTFDRDIAVLISQYLDAHHSSLARQFDEEVLGEARDNVRHQEIADVERAILDGDYGPLEGLLAKPGLLGSQSQKAFLYMCFRQQFLEHIDNREHQKAFNLLQKRLKPLEHYQPVPYDFYNLCYLTSAGTVHDAPAMRDWVGTGPERERLVGMWRELVERKGRVGDGEQLEQRDVGLSSEGAEGDVKRRSYAPPERLKTLLRQAAAWQLTSTKRRGQPPWTVSTLMRDYEAKVVPSRLVRLVEGHRANVKCVATLSPGIAVSGSSDSTLRIFSTETGSIRLVLAGHTSRIWDCAVSTSSTSIASASGDESVRIWNAHQGICRTTLRGDGGDVYGVRWRPDREDQVVSASYDKIIRLWDVEKGRQIRTFSGHSQSTLAVAFDPTGGLLASGSKDKHVRLWDVVAGVCVQAMPACLGEITSVEIDRAGRYLLAGCKDNSNRLYDLRMHRILYRYTGYQNTAKNLIRCSFASTDLIVGGSEDGMVYIWEREGPQSESIKPPAMVSLNGTTGASGYSSPYTSPPVLHFNPSSSANSGGTSLTVPTNGQNPASSPVYYPTREARIASGATARSGGATVRPLSVLEGHGEGAVFDVKWTGEGLISAGEDGKVGVWGIVDDQDEEV